MPTITIINGMERFNAHVWHEVSALLQKDGVVVRILCFHDGHVQNHDAALVKAISEADVLFVSLINDRNDADWLTAQLKRGRSKTVFAYESMPEVMGLTQVGDYRIDTIKPPRMSKLVQVILRLITQGRDEDTLYAYTKLTKVAAKLLPLLPVKQKDFRTWLRVNSYWNQPDAVNLSQMICVILRDCLNVKVRVAPVRTMPQMGCFHPDTAELFADNQAYMRWALKTKRYRRGQPLVAVLVLRKHLLQQQTYPHDIIQALEAKNLAVLPIFVSDVEVHVALRDWVAKEKVDFVISTLGFGVVADSAGSMRLGANNDISAEILSGIDVPYMVAQPLLTQSRSDWQGNGVAPIQSMILYDLPEMDGSISPIVIGAIADNAIVTIPDRIARVATIVERWVRLRRKPPQERRVALVLYNYPPGLGRLGTAALLNVPATLHALLTRLKKEHYKVTNLPETVAELTKRVAAMAGGQGEQVSFAVAQMREVIPDALLCRVDAKWGAAPGQIAANGHDAIRLDGFELGNLFVGVQPPLGVPGDPMQMLSDREYVPHHQFLAFYRYLIDVWHADAIVHVGMQGTAEWLPGLQLGLTGDCWPDIVMGDIPQLYLYPLNNPATANIAKRRGGATVISHLIPPYTRAGLYKQLAQLRVEIANNASIDTVTSLVPELPVTPGEATSAYVARVSRYLDDLEQRLILDGLHVLGAHMSRDRAQALLESTLDIARNNQSGLMQHILDAGIDTASAPAVRAAFVERVVLGREVLNTFWRNYYGKNAPSNLQTIVDHGREILVRLEESGDELDVVMHALNGGYVLPGKGADPIRSGAAGLPSGRNIYSTAPWCLPSDVAMMRGVQMADQLIAAHVAAHGSMPVSVALTLWALDTIKSEGESIGVALGLIGAQPMRDGQGKIYRFDLIPLHTLGRARVDVVLNISSVFRDNFQIQLDLFDDLMIRAAKNDEPRSQNPIAAHVATMQQHGQTFESATARLFTQAPGEYGTGIAMVVDERQWDNRVDLASIYVQRSGFAYGGQRGGQAAQATYRSLLGTVEHVFQAIDSVEYGLTDMQHYYGHSGAVQLAASFESGKQVSLSYAESFTGRTTLTKVKQMLSIEVRTKLLNPRWFEPLLAQGYAGATEIANRFTILFGWGAVGDNVEKWIFDGMAHTFMLDEDVQRRFATANPHAAKAAVLRLLEANSRGMWQCDAVVISQLQQIHADLTARLADIVA